MSKKICVSCEDTVDKLTLKMFSTINHKIPDWFKRIGNYSLLPPPLNGNPTYNLYGRNNIKPICQDNYDTTLQLDLSKLMPNVKNTWIFYWASNNRDYLKTKYPSAEIAYGNFNNCGLSRLSNIQKTTFKFNNPVPYQVDNNAYPPHIHFVSLNHDNLWNTKLHTYLITPNINLTVFKKLLASGKYLVINAIPESINFKNIPDSIRLSTDNNKRQINDTILMSLNEHLIKNYKKITEIPIIVYCKNPECTASGNLIKILRELGYINITTFKGGIDKYFTR